jgi:hypothetical protein
LLFRASGQSLQCNKNECYAAVGQFAAWPEVRAGSFGSGTALFVHVAVGWQRSQLHHGILYRTSLACQGPAVPSSTDVVPPITSEASGHTFFMATRSTECSNLVVYMYTENVHNSSLHNSTPFTLFPTAATALPASGLQPPVCVKCQPMCPCASSCCCCVWQVLV